MISITILFSPISIFNLPFSIFNILNSWYQEYIIISVVLISFFFAYLFLYFFDSFEKYKEVTLVLIILLIILIFNKIYTILGLIMLLFFLNTQYFNSIFMSKTASFLIIKTYKSFSNLIFNFVKNLTYKKSLMILYLFLSILFCNLLGILLPTPAIMTSLIYSFILTLNCFAIFLFIWFTQYFSGVKNFVMPKMDNKLLKNILLSIETLSFLARFISLPVRLFSNIFAGHILLKLISVFTFLFLSSLYSSFIFLFAGVFAWSLLLIISIFEIAMAIVQAYVLTMLLTSYYSEYL
jgi:F-type H+-transporting ATPase subunit a